MELAWPNDPESSAGGSVATARASHAGQVKGDDPARKWLGVGREANNLTSVKYVIVEKPNNGRLLDNSDKRPRENHKDGEVYIATWNVLSLYGAETLKQLKTELEKYRIDIAAVQEIRCREVERWMQGSSYWCTVVMKVQPL